ncbi:MAG TPA: hypothetical protein VFO10_10740 [Oligoflexus sp.]|uniref:hypothetical protein n=1 Tax=Oligoflexus sp. TaxID=1971216 RepID=UPI002D7EB33A|nr:hypothetical protein [Oligoflexus sp.]HET9237721.1 hypothetical protein [Oligoflexus sp.]
MKSPLSFGKGDEVTQWVNPAAYYPSDPKTWQRHFLAEDIQLLEQLVSWKNEVGTDSGYIGEASFTRTENGKMKLTGVKKSL